MNTSNKKLSIIIMNDITGPYYLQKLFKEKMLKQQAAISNSIVYKQVLGPLTRAQRICQDIITSNELAISLKKQMLSLIQSLRIAQFFSNDLLDFNSKYGISFRPRFQRVRPDCLLKEVDLVMKQECDAKEIKITTNNTRDS